MSKKYYAAWFIVIALCAMQVGCSKVHRYAVVLDGLVTENKIFFLIHADEYLDRGLLTPEGGGEPILNTGYAIAVVDFTNSHSSNLVLKNYWDIGKDNYSKDNYLSSRLCSSSSFLKWEGGAMVKKYDLINDSTSQAPESFSFHKNDFVCSRFVLSPNGKSIVGYGVKPFAIKADTLKPTSFKLSEKCADVLCSHWTNRYELAQVATASDDLNAVAVQSMNSNDDGSGNQQYTVWNLEEDKGSHTIVANGPDIITLSAVQLVNGKVWSLFYTIPDAGSTRAALLTIVDEDGKVIGRTQRWGGRVIVDTGFSRIIQYHSSRTNLCIKVWHPIQNTQEMFNVSTANAYSDLYKNWKK